MLHTIKKLLILSSLLVLSACGSDNNDEPETEANEIATEVVDEIEKVEDHVSEEVDEQTEEPVEEVAEEAPAPAPETSEYQWLYDESNGKSFIFSSGAGAWRTIIEVTNNGQFTGHFSDADGLDVYVSEFTGRFKINQELNEYT